MVASARDGRRGAESYGRFAERLCRLALRLNGYRILARRLRTPMGEIDIVAAPGGAARGTGRTTCSRPAIG